MVEEIIREGRWICPNCNSKNKGSNITCNSCGSARGDVEFIYEEDAEEITDQGEVAKALEGADWVCGYCSCSNEAGRTACKQCSAKHDDGKKRQQKDLELDAEGHVRKPGEGKGLPGSSKPGSVSAVTSPSPSGCAKCGCVTLLLLFMMLFAVDWMCGSVQTMEVSALSWTRTQVVEEYQTVRKGDWKGSVPGSAKVLSQTRKQRTTRDVPDGTYQADETYTVEKKVGTRRVKTGVKDLGNGRFKEIYAEEPVYKTETRTKKVTKTRYRKEPVYDTWVDYTVLEWRPIDTLTTSGTTETPAWPAVEIPPFSVAAEGSRRLGPRSEKYKAVFNGPKGDKLDVDKVDSKPLSADQFLKLRPGTKWKLSIGGLGSINRIDPPTP